MASFTIRVELHDADWGDYTKLHGEMTKRGFSQTVCSDGGKVYELPPAEYNLIGELTRSQVLDRAKAAASAVKQKFGVIVTESAGRTWFGLQST